MSCPQSGHTRADRRHRDRRHPNIGYATLAILVGIGFILNGIGMTALGWGMQD